MKLINISSFKPGKQIQGFYLCKEKSVRNTKSGDIYLDIQLLDRTGKIYGKVWDNVDHFSDKFNSGEAVAVKGKVTEFNSQPQLIIKQINTADTKKYGKYGYSPELIIPTISESTDKLMLDIQKIILSIKHKGFQMILQTIFKKYNQEILSIPASVNHDHPVRGGFLKHLHTTSHVAIDIAHRYNINRDLLITGIMLHDIGKVKSITMNLEPTHTDIGRLVGYNALGRDILVTACKDSKISNEEQLKLEHIIISHQENVYKGSSIKPKFPEALLVHYIDEMDGRLDIMKNIIQQDQSLDWTNDINQFHTRLWKK